MTKNRVEAFSDGVFAVAITLLVLNLHVPNPGAAGPLAHRLGEQWPSYAAYVVSFLTIGIIWINHHAIFRRLLAVDHRLLVLNLLLLLMVTTLPFSTALMAQYLRVADGQHLAAVIYGASYLAISLGFLALNQHVLFVRRHLLAEHMTREVCRSVARRGAFGTVPYLLAMVGGLITPYLTLIVCATVAAFYGLPSATADRETSSDDVVVAPSAPREELLNVGAQPE